MSTQAKRRGRPRILQDGEVYGRALIVDASLTRAMPSQDVPYALLRCECGEEWEASQQRIRESSTYDVCPACQSAFNCQHCGATNPAKFSRRSRKTCRACERRRSRNGGCQVCGFPLYRRRGCPKCAERGGR